MPKRRLTKTAVEDAIRETKTRPFVDRVCATEKLADGRNEVDVILFDALDNPRKTPSGEALIGHLESSGWVVEHQRGRDGRRPSRLIVSEPTVTPVSDAPEKGRAMSLPPDDYDPVADFVATGSVLCGDCGTRLRPQTLASLPPHGCAERQQANRAATREPEEG